MADLSNIEIRKLTGAVEEAITYPVRAAGVRSNGNGLGVVSMEERAHLAGGTLEIITHPGEGTRVRVRVPGAPASAVAAS